MFLKIYMMDKVIVSLMDTNMNQSITNIPS